MAAGTSCLTDVLPTITPRTGGLLHNSGMASNGFRPSRHPATASVASVSPAERPVGAQDEDVGLHHLRLGPRITLDRARGDLAPGVFVPGGMRRHGEELVDIGLQRDHQAFARFARRARVHVYLVLRYLVLRYRALQRLVLPCLARPPCIAYRGLLRDLDLGSRAAEPLRFHGDPECARALVDAQAGLLPGIGGLGDQLMDFARRRTQHRERLHI